MAIWFVAILFGSPETRDIAWSLLVYAIMFALGAAILVGVFIAVKNR